MGRFAHAAFLAGVLLVASASARVPCKPRSESKTYEAEDAILSPGVKVESAQPGFSGTVLCCHPNAP